MIQNKKIIGFTFGGKGIHKDFYKSKFRLQKEALDTGWFEKFVAFGDEDLEKYQNSKSGAGIGFWFWKPALALEMMNNGSDNDIFVFMDAGCSIFKNENSEKRFFEYVNMCNTGPGFVVFGGNNESFPQEIQYTKRDTLILMGCDTSEYLYTSQIASGVWFFKNNKFSRDLLTEWKSLCDIEHMINWEKSYNKEHPQFHMHRFEQSVFSLLCKKRNNVLKDFMLDPHEMAADINIDPNYLYPIKATRICDADMD